MRLLRLFLVGSLWLPMAGAYAEQKPLWELGFGVAPMVLPDYRGSDESRGYALPLPYIVYRGDILRVDRGGIYGRLIDGQHTRLDLSFDAGVPVDSSKNRARQGMPDLDAVFEVGPSLEICLWNECGADRVAQFRLPVRAVFSTDFGSVESRGGTVFPHFNIDIKNIGPGDGWNFGASLGLLYASERYHDYYYEVLPAYATATRPAYDAGGGYSGTRLALTLSKRFRHVWVGGFVRYDDLSGAVFEDSPLMRIHRSFQAGLAAAWVFDESGQMVEVRD
jgi:MipA family protein